MLDIEKIKIPLRKFLKREGAEYIHFPYSASFEQLCSEICVNPSARSKHQIWETLLDIQRESISSSDGQSSNQLSPSEFVESESLSETYQGKAAIRPSVPLSPFRDNLFSEIDDVAAQPWRAPSTPGLSFDELEKRKKILASLSDSYLGTTEQKVAYILHRFPETRDSDIALCIRYWRKFQANIVEKWNPVQLEILFDIERQDTISRVRRVVQNDLQLFRAKDTVLSGRDAAQQEFHNYIASHRDTLPEIRFYLDETGNERAKTYKGVAGLCVMNWRQYEKHHAALDQWRNAQEWPENIHFSEITGSILDRSLALLSELEKRRSGLLFLGYSLSSQGLTSNTLYMLFIQLIVDSIYQLRDAGCLDKPISLKVIKEAEVGFDKFYLHSMQSELESMTANQFPGIVSVQPIETRPKGREVFLECADLIAGAMQRKSLVKGTNPKDRLTNAVFRVTGFEDDLDNGALFKHHN